MYWATVKYRRSRIDQANVHLQFDEWKKSHSEDSFFFKPHSDDDEEINVGPSKTEEEGIMDEEDEEEEEVLLTEESGEQSKKLLFVHQAAWQRRLLQRYGNESCLLDATYKTTRYALPLFFLAVKTRIIKSWGPLLLRMNPLCQ